MSRARTRSSVSHPMRANVEDATRIQQAALRDKANQPARVHGRLLLCIQVLDASGGSGPEDSLVLETRRTVSSAGRMGARMESRQPQRIKKGPARGRVTRGRA